MYDMIVQHFTSVRALGMTRSGCNLPPSSVVLKLDAYLLQVVISIALFKVGYSMTYDEIIPTSFELD